MKKEVLRLHGMQVFVYSFELMDSRMYMVREREEMLVVDPCVDDALLEDAEGVQRAIVLLTHEHFDHISGVNWLREHFSCVVCAGGICARRVQSVKDNLSSRFAFLFIMDREKYDYVRRNIPLPYICAADESFSVYGKFYWQSHAVEFYEVGGHSPGSCLIVLDKNLIFAGDNVLGNGRELQGTETDAEGYQRNVRPLLKRLGLQTYVLPGHGGSASLAWFWDRLPKECHSKEE